jgi:hypothetical protein
MAAVAMAEVQMLNDAKIDYIQTDSVDWMDQSFSAMTVASMEELTSMASETETTHSQTGFDEYDPGHFIVLRSDDLSPDLLAYASTDEGTAPIHWHCLASGTKNYDIQSQSVSRLVAFENEYIPIDVYSWESPPDDWANINAGVSDIMLTQYSSWNNYVGCRCLIHNLVVSQQMLLKAQNGSSLSWDVYFRGRHVGAPGNFYNLDYDYNASDFYDTWSVQEVHRGTRNVASTSGFVANTAIPNHSIVSLTERFLYIPEQPTSVTLRVSSPERSTLCRSQSYRVRLYAKDGTSETLVHIGRSTCGFGDDLSRATAILLDPPPKDHFYNIVVDTDQRTDSDYSDGNNLQCRWTDSTFSAVSALHWSTLSCQSLQCGGEIVDLRRPAPFVPPPTFSSGEVLGIAFGCAAFVVVLGVSWRLRSMRKSDSEEDKAAREEPLLV